MYQSHVYLEVRILLTGGAKAFRSDGTPAPEPQAAQKVCMLAQALGCVVRPESPLERISSTVLPPSDIPFSPFSVIAAENGSIQIEFHRRKKSIGIVELRLEEDAGRLTHQNGVSRMEYSNAGQASVRIRTAADFELGEEAVLFLEELRRRVQYLLPENHHSPENLIRCNAYAALAVYPDPPAYYVKLRNLNSFNFVRKAINAELDRQEEIIGAGGSVVSESRLWNERQDRTERYQDRQQTGDSRRFEPFSPPVPIRFTPYIASAAAGMTELPSQRSRRLQNAYGLTKMQADFLCDEKTRADFFEQAVFAGAPARESAHWIAGELTKLLRRTGLQLAESPLSPEYFARIMALFSCGRIHGGMTRQLLLMVLETGDDPERLVEAHDWRQLSDESEVLPFVRGVIAENPQESKKLRGGDMAPLEFLTGLVMKKTDGRAAPQTVKTLLKRELAISVVYVLSMGGAICGSVRHDGMVSPADIQVLKNLLQDCPDHVRYQVIPLGRLLSEEMEPADWALLIAEISSKLAAGTASGIVVAHGTDTLAYTAPLLYWLFSDAGAPIVLAASSATPDVSDEARLNLLFAVETAAREQKGVYVACNCSLLSPLNLKFVNTSADGFVNWHLKEPVFTGAGLLAGQFGGFHDIDEYVMKQLLRDAASKMLVCKVYPGLRVEHYVSLISHGVKYFFLELYERGTGSMRGGDYSLLPLLLKGKKHGCRFYCTSQQQTPVDFSGYTTGRRVWREGAVPMGTLTTESAVALYFAASLLSDTQDELDECMEFYSETGSGAVSGSADFTG